VDVLLTIWLCLIVGYACLCGLVAHDEKAPRWLRWPRGVWSAVAHDWRRPPRIPRRPDYARIALLERELGLIGAPTHELSPFDEGRKRAMERGL
jgi:hypothetical protein